MRAAFTPGRSLRRRRYTARHVGRTRERLAEMLVTAFKRIGEQCECDPSNLWPQQGRWRSDFRMDVCRWEGSIRLFRNGHWDHHPIMSWATMTECVRLGVSVVEGDVYGCFEAFSGADTTDAQLLADANSHYSEPQLEEIALAKARGEA